MRVIDACQTMTLRVRIQAIKKHKTGYSSYFVDPIDSGWREYLGTKWCVLVLSSTKDHLLKDRQTYLLDSVKLRFKKDLTPVFSSRSKTVVLAYTRKDENTAYTLETVDEPSLMK